MFTMKYTNILEISKNSKEYALFWYIKEDIVDGLDPDVDGNITDGK